MKLGDKLQLNLDAHEDRERAEEQVNLEEAVADIKASVRKQVNSGSIEIHVDPYGVPALYYTNSKAVLAVLKAWGLEEGLLVRSHSQFPEYHYVFEVLK